MALQHLTDEQVRTWTLEQKDSWWLANVFRGDMPQLTIRAAITGFLLGGVLSATNLYIGAKTGWTLGVGLTSVILAFAAFKTLSAAGLAKDFTILENNAMQSIATAAGYMTGPLISGIAAYMMVQDRLMPWWQMLLFNVVLSILGVLVAFPMKRRFINDEQAPFPEGRACGVVLDTLYTADAAAGLLKAKALGIAALAAGTLKVVSGEDFQTLIQGRILKLPRVVWLKENLVEWWYWVVAQWNVRVQHAPAKEPAHFKLANVDISQIGLAPAMDLAMLGAGGLMGIRSAANMFAGMVVAWAGLVPWMIARGDIAPKAGSLAAGTAVFKQNDILVKWPLWPGVVAIVLASLMAFFAKPQVILSAFMKLWPRRGAGKAAGNDVLGHIELPLWISVVGIPIVGAVGVVMASEWFGVKWYFGALAIPLIIALTLIAANATALTSITPTGALSKITQLTFGGLDKGLAARTGGAANPAVNLMTACMTTEVSSNAANLLMDIKPGYMLGAKPRQQAIGHCIGIVAGAIASTPLFYVLFLAGHENNPFTGARPEAAGKSVADLMISERFSFVGAQQWRAISRLINEGASFLPVSAQWAMGAAIVLTLLFEGWRIATKGRLPISPLAFGLGSVIPPESTLWMFLGSLVFWGLEKRYRARRESRAHALWVEGREPICAGLIAGWSLLGIAEILVKVFALRPAA